MALWEERLKPSAPLSWRFGGDVSPKAFPVEERDAVKSQFSYSLNLLLDLGDRDRVIPGARQDTDAHWHKLMHFSHGRLL